MHLKDRRQGPNKCYRVSRGENRSKQDKWMQSHHMQWRLHMSHCPSKWGACSSGTVFPGRARPWWVGALTSCPGFQRLYSLQLLLPNQTRAGSAICAICVWEMGAKSRPKRSSFMRSVNTNPQVAHITLIISILKRSTYHLLKDTNSRSPANAKYYAESHSTDSGEKRQKAAFFMIPFWTHCIISGLYIKTDVSLISQSQRNHSVLVLWRMFLQMNSFNFKQDLYLME